MSCIKSKFKTEKDAELALEHIRKVNKKYKRDKKPIRCYQCGYCNQFHLTSKPADVNTIRLIYFDKFLTILKNNKRKSHSK